MLAGDAKKDKAARFHWRLLTALWNYAADCLPEIADSAASVDRAMRAGFNWEMGPFELWDAAGVPDTVARMKAAGERVSPNVERLLAAGAGSWYRNHGRECFDLHGGAYVPIPEVPGIARVAKFKAANGVVKENPGASLVDLGDGVACIELHSMKNAIGEDIVRLVTETLRGDGEAVRNFDAFVISGDADQFSVGANLMQLLLSAQEGEWDEVDLMVRAFQRMTSAIKFCPQPVVAAPFGFCLGGGAEIALAAVRRQVHAELYMGLVETGVGLLPAGGGCKEMTLHAVDTAAAFRESGRGESVELMDALRRNFETIAMAKVSTSALDARRLGFVAQGDRITMNRERLLLDAKHLARAIADAGYAPPVPRTDIPAPGENVLATLQLGVYMMRQGDFISDHDVKVANRVAHVLCGGKVTPGTPVSEQYLLDLEREAFLSLCGEKKTQERIAFTLKTGKPLEELRRRINERRCDRECRGTAVGKAPKGTLRATRPDDLGAAAIQGALARVPALDTARNRGCHHRLRHAGRRAGHERGAHLLAACRPAGRIRRHDDQPLLRFGPAVDRAGSGANPRRRAPT